MVFHLVQKNALFFFTSDNLIILNEGGFTEVATIKMKDINSLIIDEKEML